MAQLKDDLFSSVVMCLSELARVHMEDAARDSEPSQTGDYIKRAQFLMDIRSRFEQVMTDFPAAPKSTRQFLRDEPDDDAPRLRGDAAITDFAVDEICRKSNSHDFMIPALIRGIIREQIRAALADAASGH